MVRVAAAAALLCACAPDYASKSPWETAPGGWTSAMSDAETSAAGSESGSAPTEDEPDSSGTDDATPMVTSGSDDATPPGTPKEALCEFLQELPVPDTDPTAVVDWWEAFVTAYPDRHHGAANNLAAAQFLRSELTALGYTTSVLQLPSSSGTVGVVEAISPGVKTPDRYVGLGAHYDVVPATVQGAYDNASGVAIQLELCRLLRQIPTQKSVACLFFDAEEIGRAASQAYVSQYVESGSKHFDQLFGYDMVGLNWPAPGPNWKLYLSMGLEGSLLRPHLTRHAQRLDIALFDCMAAALALPASGVEIVPYYDKRSDEASFMEADVPIVRFAGGREASDYSGYHGASDTIATVYDVAGGRAGFEQGIASAIEVSYYSILAFDREDPLALPDL